MKTEIEAKFLDVDFDEIRSKLKSLGAVCEQPMRLMQRAIIDYPDRRMQTGDPWAFIRVRDEGDKIVLTYKQHSYEYAADSAREIETVVSDFDTTIQIFEAIGMKCFSIQQTKRETWKFNGIEVVLDEWPWLKPYIEIEGESERAIRECAHKLGFDWDDAVFGDAMKAYQAQYPHLTEDDTLAYIESVKFGDPLPGMLKLQK